MVPFLSAPIFFRAALVVETTSLRALLGAPVRCSSRCGCGADCCGMRQWRADAACLSSVAVVRRMLPEWVLAERRRGSRRRSVKLPWMFVSRQGCADNGDVDVLPPCSKARRQSFDGLKTDCEVEVAAEADSSPNFGRFKAIKVDDVCAEDWCLKCLVATGRLVRLVRGTGWRRCWLRCAIDVDRPD